MAPSPRAELRTIRPAQVKVAVVLLILAYGEASINLMVKAGLRDPLLYLLGAPTLAVAFFVVIMVYQGKSWARMVFTMWTLGWLGLLAVSLVVEGAIVSGKRFGVLIIELILVLCAAALLFTPRANAWFRNTSHGSCARKNP